MFSIMFSVCKQNFVAITNGQTGLQIPNFQDIIFIWKETNGGFLPLQDCTLHHKGCLCKKYVYKVRQKLYNLFTVCIGVSIPPHKHHRFFLYKPLLTLHTKVLLGFFSIFVGYKEKMGKPGISKHGF